MTRLIVKSWFWLLLLTLASLGVFAARTGMAPVREPDTLSYETMDWSTLQGVLKHLRTPGYPAFLKFAGLLASDHRAVPCLQWLAGVGAAFALYWGLRQAGYRRWTALWASWPVLFGHAILFWGKHLIADSLAISLGIAATGCFLGALWSPKRWPWFILAVLTFVAYQVRPAYLFLMALWPLMLVLFDYFLRADSLTAAARGRRAAWMLALMAVPFLAYCSARLAVVGHFGLVSFGGLVATGITGQFLDDQLISELPEELRPLASRIVEIRSGWDDAKAPTDYMAVEDMYNAMIWQASLPAATELYGNEGGGIEKANQMLSRLSREIASRRPRKFIQWLGWNTKHGVHQIFESLAIDWGTLLLIASLTVGQAMALLRRSSASVHSQASIPPTDWETLFRERQLLFWMALAFAASKTLLVILVEPTIGRFMMGVACLIPCVLGLWISLLLRDFFPRLAHAIDVGGAK